MQLIVEDADPEIIDYMHFLYHMKPGSCRKKCILQKTKNCFEKTNTNIISIS